MVPVRRPARHSRARGRTSFLPLSPGHRPHAEVEPNPEGQDGYFIPPPRRARGGIEPAPNISTVDRNLKTPHQDEFIIAFEREVATETSIRVEYVNRKFRDQFQDIDINRVTGDYGRCKVATVTNNSVLEESPGTGFYTDPYTGEQVFDNDPGPGDGFNDDCAGDIVENFGEEPPPDDPFAPDVRREQPDGVPDLYTQNPAWGSIFLVGNFNSSDYEAFVVELNRRQYRSWEMNASYTWSYSQGNGEDFNQFLRYRPLACLKDDEFGFQSTDQRHIVRQVQRRDHHAVGLPPRRNRPVGSPDCRDSILDPELSRSTPVPPPAYTDLGSYTTRHDPDGSSIRPA